MKICVIGAGASGLCAIKELIEEGHQVVCYEKYGKEGGVFNNGSPASKTYDSLKLTVSNYFMAYSALPPGRHEGRQHWTRIEYEEYLRSYARKFQLLPHIRFEHEVEWVEPAGEGFAVKVKYGGETHCAQFDAVVVSTGSFRKAKMPRFEGLDSFKGTVCHSDGYRNPAPFAGKRVVCVGIGESGADIAHEISNVAEHCTLSMRHYPSIFPRWFFGDTGDSRSSLAFASMTYEGINWFLRNKARFVLSLGDRIPADIRFYFEWLLKPTHFINQFVTKNDIFFKDVAEGRLAVNVGGIARLDGDRVIFRDGTAVEADIVMCSTGYRDEFEFLHPSLRPTDVRRLFQHMIHPDWREKLAFVGWARPLQGGVPACSEMQSRYLSLLLAEKRQLPDDGALRIAIENDAAEEDAAFFLSPDIRSLVDYDIYMPRIARLIGCHVRPLQLLSPTLWYKLWFGSHLSVFYRLFGPGQQRAQAIEIIKKLPVTLPFTTRCVFLAVACVYAMKGALRYFAKPPRPALAADQNVPKQDVSSTLS